MTIITELTSNQDDRIKSIKDDHIKAIREKRDKILNMMSIIDKICDSAKSSDSLSKKINLESLIQLYCLFEKNLDDQDFYEVTRRSINNAILFLKYKYTNLEDALQKDFVSKIKYEMPEELVKKNGGE